MTKADKRAAVGGFLWILAMVQYFVAQVAVASQWRVPYSWWDNSVGDLGNTGCGQFMANEVCSPLAGSMNAAFIIAGLLTAAGIGLTRSVWPATGMASVGVLLWILAGAGQVLVGVAPENENLPLHMIGELHLPLASVAILLLGLASRRSGLGVFGIVMAVVGLGGVAMSIFAPDVIGVGGAERLAGYPSALWLFVVGAAALLPNREPASAEVLTEVS
jgi:hypothetical membrane protein